MFLRFFDKGLGQSSFILACERTRQAAVIDPRREGIESVNVTGGMAAYRALEVT